MEIFPIRLQSAPSYATLLKWIDEFAIVEIYNYETTLLQAIIFLSIIRG